MMTIMIMIRMINIMIKHNNAKHTNNTTTTTNNNNNDYNNR